MANTVATGGLAYHAEDLACGIISWAASNACSQTVLKHFCTGPTCSKAQPSGQDSRPHLGPAGSVRDQLPQDPANLTQRDEEPAGSQLLQPLWWENPLAFDSTAQTSTSLQISRTEILRVSSAIKAATGGHGTVGHSPQSHLLHQVEGQPASVMAAHAADSTAQNWGSHEQGHETAARQSQLSHAAAGTLRPDHRADDLLNVQHGLASHACRASPWQEQNITHTSFTFVAGCHHGSNQQVSCAPSPEEPASAVPDQDSITDGASGRRVLADVLNSMHETPRHGHAMQGLPKAAPGTGAGPVPGTSHGLVAVSPLCPSCLNICGMEWTWTASLVQLDMGNMHQPPDHRQAMQVLLKAVLGTVAGPITTPSHETVSRLLPLLHQPLWHKQTRAACVGWRGTGRGRKHVVDSNQTQLQ